MQIDISNLTDGEVELVKWQYRLHGGFNTTLWSAIAQADEGNLARLRRGFPDEVNAYLRFSREGGYWEDVQSRAGVAGT